MTVPAGGAPGAGPPEVAYLHRTIGAFVPFSLLQAPAG
jgi:hypothetical protein